MGLHIDGADIEELAELQRQQKVLEEYSTRKRKRKRGRRLAVI